MDFPVKMELPKLSRVHIIDMLAPLVPGIVMATGFAFSGAPSFGRFWGIQLGYKSKLALSVALAYIAGMAMMTLVDLFNHFLMKCFKQPLGGTPWDNTYWRRVAAIYLGKDLLPASLESTEDLLRFVRNTTGQASAADITAKLTLLRKKIEQLEVAAKPAKLSGSGAAVPGISQAEQASAKVPELLAAANKSVGEITSDLHSLAEETEWMALSNALDMMDLSPSPYAGFGLIMSALEAGGICAAYFILRYPELRGPSTAVFAGLVTVVAFYGVRKTNILHSYYRNMNAFQTGAMIGRLKNAKFSEHESHQEPRGGMNAEA